PRALRALLPAAHRRAEEGEVMNAKRKATLLGALLACAFYLFLILGPATAGHITGEQPAAAQAIRAF
ncbi:hypothetical protein, partial [Pseudomonas aeruginosa]|uniref:hypothetical protein n=1 Tax=Pseudomonas aeruginosa TaxID=287 RepID=UPI001968F168